jgi:hypothetical protein
VDEMVIVGGIQNSIWEGYVSREEQSFLEGVIFSGRGYVFWEGSCLLGGIIFWVEFMTYCCWNMTSCEKQKADDLLEKTLCMHV